MPVAIRAHTSERFSGSREGHPAARLAAWAIAVALLGSSAAAAQTRPGSGIRVAEPETPVLEVSPRVVADGDTVWIELGSNVAPPFLPDPERYSITLRDSEGPVALTQVLEATAAGLTLRVYVLGRGSDAAEIVIREGIPIELVGGEVVVPGGVLTTTGATWFQGSGVRRIAGPVMVLPSAGGDPATWSGSAGIGSPSEGDPTASPQRAGLGTRVFSDLLAKPLCFPGWRLPIEIEFGCKEIVAKARVKGDDPFEPPGAQDGEGDPRRPKLAGPPLGGDFAGLLELHLEVGPGVVADPDTSGMMAEALALALSRAFGTFGIEAEPAPEGKPAAVLFAGRRVHGQGAAALTDLVCVR
ncbi:MAG: hypothetical protein MI919_38955 [Holophagales bacterium]|nr:hypothetical protein [Holophagales bacterium]